MYKKKVLKNGLRIIAVPIRGSQSVTVMTMVEAGSEYETKDKNGISHFLEHMFFKGTERRPKSIDIWNEFESIGAYNNAFTGYEYTGYYAKSAPKYFDKILDIISDMYINSTIPEGEMEKEKGVITEEINMYEDTPDRIVWDVFSETLYGDQPAGWNIAGTIKNVQDMKREDFIKYRKEHYVANKTVVVVAGDIDTGDVFKKVEKSFANLPNSRRQNKRKVVDGKQIRPQVKVKHKETDQAHLIIGVRSFDIQNKKIPALKVMNTILGGGASFRLFQKMRNELGICYYVSSDSSEFSDHGYLTVAAGVDKDRINVAVEGILEEMRRIRDEKVSPGELKRAKDYMVGRLYLGLESSNSFANFYSFQEIMREKIKTPKEIEKEIRAVTIEDVQKVAREIMQNKKLNMALVGNAKEEQLRKILFL